MRRNQIDEFDELDDDEQLTQAEAAELRQRAARWRIDNTDLPDPNTPLAVACAGVLSSLGAFAAYLQPCFGLLAILGTVCAFNAIATRKQGLEPGVTLAVAGAALLLAVSALLLLVAGLPRSLHVLHKGSNGGEYGRATQAQGDRAVWRTATPAAAPDSGGDTRTPP